nr:MAG TPA: hypothetical protein [Bacteriophage sp.]
MPVLKFKINPFIFFLGLNDQLKTILYKSMPQLQCRA